MAISAASWYETDPDLSAYYQGDVLEDVPVVLMPPAGGGPWILLRPSAPVTLADALVGNIPKVFRPYVDSTAPERWATPDELVLAKATKRKVMVLTQTCDLERRKFVLIAPVYVADALSAPKRSSLEVNEINYLFYLPEGPPTFPQKSFADLSQMTSIHGSYIRGARLIKRLSNEARTRLQTHLATLHGRPFGFSTKDSVPQNSDYLCVRCFLTSATVQRKYLKAGPKFDDCPVCGTRALWVKFG